MPKVKYYVTSNVAFNFSLLSYEHKYFIVPGFFAEEWVGLLPALIAGTSHSSGNCPLLRT